MKLRYFLIWKFYGASTGFKKKRKNDLRFSHWERKEELDYAGSNMVRDAGVLTRDEGGWSQENSCECDVTGDIMDTFKWSCDAVSQEANNCTQQFPDHLLTALSSPGMLFLQRTKLRIVFIIRLLGVLMTIVCILWSVCRCCVLPCNSVCLPFYILRGAHPVIRNIHVIKLRTLLD